MSCVINGNNKFDAIVTDPPYGYRASARKAKNYGLIGDFHGTEITNCDLLVKRLFEVANKNLIKGGRLVFLYPIEK